MAGLPVGRAWELLKGGTLRGWCPTRMVLSGGWKQEEMLLLLHPSICHHLQADFLCPATAPQVTTQRLLLIIKAWLIAYACY